MRQSLRRGLRATLNEAQGVVKEAVDHARFGDALMRETQGRKGIRLHIGCGPRVMDGWTNIDMATVPGRATYFNAVNPLSISDGAVSRIHCEHFLEHLEFSDAIEFLKECHRVLADDGTMRVIVPDAELYMRAYVSKDKPFFESLANLGNPAVPFATAMEVCNQMFRMGGAHAFAWDFETLSTVCRQIGFSSCERSAWRQPADSVDIDGQDDWRGVDSLFTEIRR